MMFMVENLLSTHGPTAVACPPYVAERREVQEAAGAEKAKEKRDKEAAVAARAAAIAERERQERLERERSEKRAAEQAVHKHFEESLRLAQQRGTNNMCWINSLPGGPRGEEKQQHPSSSHQPPPPPHPPPPSSSGSGGGGHQVVLALDHRLGPPQHHHHSASHPVGRVGGQDRGGGGNPNQSYYQQQGGGSHQGASLHAPPRTPPTASPASNVPPPPHHLIGGYHHEAQTRVTKVEYPPPAHSRSKPVVEKAGPGGTHQIGLPKAEPNFGIFGYGPYHHAINFLHHEKAVKEPSAMIIAKGGKEVPSSVGGNPPPPPLLSDLKNSVIVKNSKSPGPQEKKYLAPTTAKNPYEYRSPSQSPHPLAPPSPAHHHYDVATGGGVVQGGNPLVVGGKIHHSHRSLQGGQRGSPHAPPPPQPVVVQHRQSPHGPGAAIVVGGSGAVVQRRSSPHHHPQSPSPHHHLLHPSPPLHPSHHHHPSASNPLYPKTSIGGGSGAAATVSSYPYPTPPPPPSAVHYAPPPQTAPLKPKPQQATIVVAPPQPQPQVLYHHHQPQHPTKADLPPQLVRSCGGVVQPPHPPQAKPVTPSPYRSVSQHNLPPPGLGGSPSPVPGVPPQGTPPIAHATPKYYRPHHPPVVHERPPLSPPLPLQGGTTSSAGESPFQTQPLDLGVSSSSSRAVSPASPKRKAEEDPHGEPLEIKKFKIEDGDEGGGTVVITVRATPPPPHREGSSPLLQPPFPRGQTPTSMPAAASTPPMDSRPSTPLIATTNVSGQVNNSQLESNPTDSSPARPASTSYPVHKLKKAWLQRHSGEDTTENSTDIKGSGVCVTLPMPVISPTPPSTVGGRKLESSGMATTTVVNSLHNIGSMAVNSIKKPKTSRKTSKELNGHGGGGGTASKTIGGDAEDSSSSDPDRKTTPQKRVPPKMKRKKSGRKGNGGGGGVVVGGGQEDSKRKKTIGGGVSSTESEKESGSEKDSDGGSGERKRGEEKEKSSGGSGGTSGVGSGKRRGRRPKAGGGSGKGGGGGEEEGRGGKRGKEEDPPTPNRDPIQKPSIGQLKKTGESFLQDGPCFEVAPKLAKCRECRWTPNQRNRNMPNIFCRFYAFRRLRYTKNGQLAIAGFSDPHRDALQEDLKLWLPSLDSASSLDPEMSRFLLAQLGDQFCDLLQQEKEASSIHMSEDKTIAWKRVVQFVREMCDVCETTLFNFHWACGKCGFVVCIDCYKGRKNGTVKIWGEAGRDRDDLSWLLCTNRQPHEQEKLMLTQIIAGDSLATIGKKVHEARALWNIPMYCGCPLSSIDQSIINPTSLTTQPNGISKDLIKSLTRKAEAVNGSGEIKIKEENNKTDDNNSSLSWLADVALSNEDKKNCEESISSSDSEEDDKEGNYSTLRELLIRPSSGKTNGSSGASSPNNPGSGGGQPIPPQQQSPPTQQTQPQQQLVGGGGICGKSKKPTQLETLDEVISSVIEHSVGRGPEGVPGQTQLKTELKHFVRRYSRIPKGREPLPIRIMTLTESKQLYPDVPHAWLCDGKLLRLLDSSNPNNYRVFQDQWKRGQPVIVSDMTHALDSDLWAPESFLRDFGDTKNDLVNCSTGKMVPNQPMKRFWEGFMTISKRLKDEKGNPMLLKLKDWPPGDDFAEMLPSRFFDLMKVLPLGEYTQRVGRLNLASRLPDCFVRPDLGPKMYTAYGSASSPMKGTTNLHLDISDAVNVMVHVGIPTDANEEQCIKEVLRAIDEAGCDALTRRRVREKGQLPGALWHIYMARDADKIRDLLNKVAIEGGSRLEPHHDPIHDQSWYLDNTLRERLYKEYGVEGYSIVQCLGDAVFVPAGAPHQVRNLHNCIKVAEDFVSPENVAHCFNLTQEFRDLSDTHTNHEDKLQIKNIVYHAVKDSLASLGGSGGSGLQSQIGGGESKTGIAIKEEISSETHLDQNQQQQSSSNPASNGGSRRSGEDMEEDEDDEEGEES